MCHPMYKVIQEIKYRFKHNGEKSPTYYEKWRRYYFLGATFIFSYLPVIFVNLLTPAWSPRIYIESMFTHQVKYFSILRFLNVQKKESANSFPSGHLAETLCFVFTLYVIGYRRL